MRSKLEARVGTTFLILAMTLFASAAGVFIRDIGGGVAEEVNGPIEPGGGFENRFNAYELTYDLAVFSTVQVSTTIDAVWGDWRMEFQSNGSFLTSFRPELPGLHRLVILNLENRSGQLGYSLLQLGSLPPELETSLLDPMLYGAGILLVAAAITFTYSSRRNAGQAASTPLRRLVMKLCTKS